MLRNGRFCCKMIGFSSKIIGFTFKMVDFSLNRATFRFKLANFSFKMATFSVKMANMSFKIATLTFEMVILSFQKVPGQDLAENGPLPFVPHKAVIQKGMALLLETRSQREEGGEQGKEAARKREKRGEGERQK